MELFWHMMWRMAQAFAVGLALPLLAACIMQEWPAAGAFLVTLLVASGVAFGFLLRSRNSDRRGQMTVREGALFMVSVWLVLGMLGMLPYLLAGLTSNPVAAFFASVSALTTTGLPGLELARTAWPHSMVLWHCLMSWLGGLGFVVMLVTVLPQVSGCFGLTLSARQTFFFSPVCSKMRESVLQGVKVYLALTVAAFLIFILTGLSPTGAIFMALITLSTGGDVDTFSLALGRAADEGLPAIQPDLQAATILAMFLASMNLLLCWKVWSRRSLVLLLEDTELHVFTAILALAAVLLTAPLWGSGEYGLEAAAVAAVFQALSFISTSGLTLEPVWLWTDFERCVLMLLAFVGGCIGSVTGGLKVMRLLVLFRVTNLGLRSAMHPRAVTVTKLDGLPIAEKITGRIFAFFFIYITAFIGATLVLSITLDGLVDAMRLAAACLTCSGGATTLGQMSTAGLPGWAQLFCVLLMIAGRIEVFSVLVVAGVALHSYRERW